jgi:isoleucyl-tRNA synthetase
MSNNQNQAEDKKNNSICEAEEKALSFWKENNIFEKLVAKDVLIDFLHF